MVLTATQNFQELKDFSLEKKIPKSTKIYHKILTPEYQNLNGIPSNSSAEVNLTRSSIQFRRFS